MTLDNFFTSTELKNGLTTPTRVNELLTVMKNEKENIGKNTIDTTRQWSAVATAIAATENKECIDLFIELDGLSFIDKWLKDAQNLMNDSGSGVLDESIIVMLLWLERLQVDQNRSMGSGIGLTVQGLLGHSSSVVREKAKDLCERWALGPNADVASTDVNSVAISPRGCNDVENMEQSVLKPEMVTELETVVNDTSNSESTPLIGSSGPLEDLKQKQEVNCLTSDIDVDHVLESATKTETMGDVIDKDEEMANGDSATEFETASGIVDSASGGGGVGDGLRGSLEVDDSKTTSDTESDEGEEKDVGIESDDDSGSHSRNSKRSTKSQDDLISKRPSDMELDYGMVDPLELARQVANEVELEVDSPEQSCSTSADEKEESSAKEVSSGPGPSPKGSPSPPEPDIRSTQNNETGQESGLNPERGFSGFDLNQEVYSDEIEFETVGPVEPFLTTISVVSASRAAAANGLPVGPLQFEGTLGWKGSAATSAFRRIPEGEKTYSSSSSQNNSNPRSNLLDFDLNVAESSDEKFQDFLSRDKVEESSRLELDLNTLGDGDPGIISLDWKRVASLTQNGVHSRTSSSMQPSFRNTDLNLNDPFLRKSFTNNLDESGISIFGTQVEVNRNEYIPHHHQHPQATNGRILEPSVDFTLGRPGSGLGLGSSNPYVNLPAYGYGHNGYPMGQMYGPPGAPMPYMVDSRRAPVMPPIPPAYSQPTQQFFFNMGPTGAPSGSNGAGPSRNSFDLNPGFITEMGNRDNNINNMGLRQFFNHNQASSSSVSGGKREEPDSGWELFPISYKHQQPPPWQ